MGNCMAVCARAPKAPGNSVQISNEDEAIRKELHSLNDGTKKSPNETSGNQDQENQHLQDQAKNSGKSQSCLSSKMMVEESHLDTGIEKGAIGKSVGMDTASNITEAPPLVERSVEDQQNRPASKKRMITSSVKKENPSIRASKDKKENAAGIVIKARSEKDNELIKTTFGEEPVVLDKIELENGITYEGAWLNGMRHGYGTQVWIDGSKYLGEWKYNEANGQGKLYHSDGDVYEGAWLNDKANGKGVYNHSNGAKYTGQWKDDKQHGKGVEEWLDGAKYEGEYEEGAKNGKGILKFLDGSYYEGQFKDNEIHGYGVYLWSENRKYEGQWAHNKMHGKGKIIWNDGRKYEGDYENDKKHGFGIFEWSDGRKYIGNWNNGKQHGRGQYVSAKGQRKIGQWLQGKRIKWLDAADKPSQS